MFAAPQPICTTTLALHCGFGRGCVLRPHLHCGTLESVGWGRASVETLKRMQRGCRAEGVCVCLRQCDLSFALRPICTAALGGWCVLFIGVGGVHCETPFSLRHTAESGGGRASVETLESPEGWKGKC